MTTEGAKAATILALMLSACASPSSDPSPEATPEIFPDPFHVIAHRGASAYAPENTAPAFQRALELGASEVELDVQLSRDGVVVLYHDASLEEKTPLRGAVRDHSADRLRATDIGSWFDRAHPEVEEIWAGTTLITLEELFERFGPALHYHIEIKSQEPELPERVLEEIRTSGLEQRVTLTSFSMDQLLRVRTRDPRVRVCLLLEKQGDATAQRRGIDAAVVLGANQVGVHARHATPELVAYAQAQGLEIRAWGIRSPNDMERAIAAGTNGMTIDWPERLIARQREYEAKH